MPQIVSMRYARAFADVLLAPRAQSNVDVELKSLEDFAQTVNSNADFRNILMSPAVSTEKKTEVAKRLANAFSLSPLALRFLIVIIEHGRIPLLSDILVSVRQDLDTRMGIARAKVTSAVDLTPEQQNDVQSRLSQLSGKQVRAEFTTDPAILGGLIARIGTTIYDGSVRGQLQALRHQFAGQTS